jgi:two-component system chemotaxis response regulator CheY
MMKILIVDDEFVSRRIMLDILAPYGICHVAADGEEAVAAFEMAWAEGQPYDLLCLDIKMPKMDGQEVLSKIRAGEAEKDIAIASGVKIIMATAMDDSKNVLGAFRSQCDAYVLKPVDKDELLKAVKSFGLIE